MAAYNFQKQFAPLVESGKKRQTIRAVGKRRHAKPGEPIQLYTGMRTKVCRKLITPDPVCVEVSPLCIHLGHPRATVYGQIIEGKALDNLAKADGFNTAEEMREWFSTVHGLPFNGLLIKWEEDHHAR